MNNKPVAWINRKGEFMPEKVDSFDIPLYTHPVKELTDEEIIDIAKEHIHKRFEGERFGYVDFARAILRKAQEK